ncbi:MAG: hypothetical protein L6264_07790 [Weeksellaceae bacterium]|nr:hypothetical protein [Bacteroidota bacterium]MCG2780837.1 hypothetical protein [Weeksellaceae bacterium]
MLRNRTYRRFAAVLFTGVYLFVALFSQNFHNHGSGEVFKDFNFKKTEKTFSTGHLSINFTDCLSCHILHDGNSLLPEHFQFSALKNEDFRKQLFACEQRFATREFFDVQLRGPPVLFI